MGASLPTRARLNMQTALTFPKGSGSHAGRILTPPPPQQMTSFAFPSDKWEGKVLQ